MTKAKAKQDLYNLFIRNGCIRLPNKKRKKEGQDYKKGYEMRWTALNQKEAALIVRMLKILDIKPGKRYLKHQRVIIPVYNKEVVTGFLGLESEIGQEKKVIPKRSKPVLKKKISKKKLPVRRKKAMPRSTVIKKKK